MTTPAGHAELTRLRRDSPITQPRAGVQLIVGCDEAVQILRDPVRFSGRHDAVARDERMLLEADAVDHGPRRRIVGRVLSPERLEAADAAFGAISARLVAGVVAKRSADLIEDLAAPLIAEVVASLLGIPEADRTRVYGWVADMARDDGLPHAVRLRRSPESWQAFRAWVLAQADARRSGQVGDDDGIGQLLKPDPVTGKSLSDDELALDVRALCQAGLGATRRLIGNLLYELVNDRELFRRVQANPDLIAGAVDESLRHAPPIQFLMRTCVEAADVAGVPMAAGDRIVISLSSINRDEKRCPHAAEFDVDRGTDFRHLAFGRGAHYCPGAGLARLVAIRAVRDLAASIESMELSPGFVYAPQQNLLAWGPRRLDVLIS
jgi:cytochrome P450